MFGRIRCFFLSGGQNRRQYSLIVTTYMTIMCIDTCELANVCLSEKCFDSTIVFSDGVYPHTAYTGRFSEGANRLKFITQF